LQLLRLKFISLLVPHFFVSQNIPTGITFSTNHFPELKTDKPLLPICISAIKIFCRFSSLQSLKKLLQFFAACSFDGISVSGDSHLIFLGIPWVI
jgi:hypothetical protein